MFIQEKLFRFHYFMLYLLTVKWEKEHTFNPETICILDIILGIANFTKTSLFLILVLDANDLISGIPFHI